MWNVCDKTSRNDAATDGSHATTEYHIQTISELILDNSMSHVDKLSEILRKSNKDNVNYEISKVINSPYGKVYIVQASNNEIFATGRGTTFNNAKTNAAFSLLSQIFSKVNVYVQRSSTSNQNWSPSIFDDNETIFDNNCKNANISTQSQSQAIRYSLCSEAQKDQKTFFHNNSNRVITATSNILCYSHEPKVENSAEENYVGLVQEFCMSYYLPLPKYFFSQEINEQGVIIFTVMCSILTFETIGNGKSKQLAKQTAACEMYLKIKKLSKTEIDSFRQKESKHKPTRVSLMPSNKPSSVLLSSKSMDRLLTFMNELKLPAINGVVDFLDSIAEDEGFSIKYINFVNETGNNVIAQLSADTVIVYLGTGNTVIEAQRSAAYSMLTYLQFNDKKLSVQ